MLKEFHKIHGIKLGVYFHMTQETEIHVIKVENRYIAVVELSMIS